MSEEKKAYRFLTGPDDAAFCQRVSDALRDGWVPPRVDRVLHKGQARQVDRVTPDDVLVHLEVVVVAREEHDARLRDLRFQQPCPPGRRP